MILPKVLFHQLTQLIYLLVLNSNQIKWDGVRTLVTLGGQGCDEIFSKRVEPRNDTFPEIVELLNLCKSVLVY
ncbi:MAG: hypothetical protein NAG76_19370 [Candidatus Pristimantibacillus lignocellulolyticus]|uniref:Uncharacterized protein n=1 Tax=Candidatus Pristimantibacillus lignocellulolyticus TaxID=2994561 RepID=A0A9J6ZD44_9BACL|nr:MAG: hypothetical protein NAG76_19370 [Candidatus Pristimantibacillus lignocellulolyticus]